VTFDGIGNGLTLSVQPIAARRLYSGTVGYQIASVNLDAVWLRLAVNESLRQSIFRADFTDYYLLGPPLQQLSYFTTITSFDVYPPS
jgi:hypothetical protein